MKIYIRISILILALLIFSLCSSTGQSSNAQKDSKEPIELSKKQKVEDIKYLFHFINCYSPFRKIVEKEFGFPDLMELEKVYIKKAKQSNSNKEFIDLVGELIQVLEQGNPHTEIMEGQKIPADLDTTSVCLQNNITPRAIELNNYWWDKLDYFSKDSYSELKVGYKGGQYVVHKDFQENDVTIKKGATISKINNLDPTEYLKSIQHKMWLRFDDKLKIPFASNGSPFSIDADANRRFWNIEVNNPDETVLKLNLGKKKGFRNAMPYPMNQENVLCKELDKSIAYLKIFNFPDTQNLNADRLIIKDFFERTESNYETLIIDLRGHNGGIPIYGEKLLIQPFLKTKQQYIQYAAVNRIIYDEILKQIAIRDSLGNPLSGVDFGQIEKIDYDKLPIEIQENNELNADLFYFKTTKQIAPDYSYNFNGKIFLLIDNNCISAAEDIIRIFKELKIGKIVGVNSLGGAAVVLPPWLFEVPNCHLLFLTEVELTFNSDGSVNELYGTKPDIELEPSTYPTTFPENFSIEELQNDKWIKWIIEKEL